MQFNRLTAAVDNMLAGPTHAGSWPYTPAVVHYNLGTSPQSAQSWRFGLALSESLGLQEKVVRFPSASWPNTPLSGIKVECCRFVFVLILSRQPQYIKKAY
jgi:hypothetical protein